MLTLPPLLDAKPGDPITAEGWNNLVLAVRNIFDTLTKAAELSVAVVDKSDGSLLQGAVVTVTSTDATAGPPRVGTFAGAGVNQYLVDRLPPGNYTVTVEADGYSPETRALTIDNSGTAQTISVLMTAVVIKVSMPALFGKALNDAIATVLGAQLQVGRIITSRGVDIPPAAVPADAALSMVLNQFPDPDLLVPVNTSIQLQVAAKAEFLAQKKVPNLSGLTLEEAKVALESAGLVLGETKTAESFT